MRLMDKARLGDTALKTLAAIRLANGTLGLLAPGFLARQTGTPPGDTSPRYAFRMFGVRTVVLGADLLLLTGEAGRRARLEAVLIHGVDTASAAVGAIRGDLPSPVARRTVAISAVNTALAVLALRYARGGD